MACHKKKLLRNCFLSLGIFLLIAIAGCARPAVSQPRQICPGKQNADHALASLNFNVRNAKPVKASGICSLVYSDEKGGKHKENLTIKIRTYPPDKIYFWCDHLLKPKAVSGGSNEKEFWFWIKLDPAMYLWGQWPQGSQTNHSISRCLEGISLSPQNLLIAFGLFSPENHSDSDYSWTLSNTEAFDVLEKLDRNGRVVKKIYVDRCTYHISRIEYLESNEITTSIELADYRQISRDFAIPARVNITSYQISQIPDTISIKLNNIGLFEISADKLGKVFRRSEPKGVDQIYKLNDNCQLVEQLN